MTNKVSVRTCLVHDHEINNPHKSLLRQVCVLLAIAFLLATDVARAQSPGNFADLHDFGGNIIDAEGKTGSDGVARTPAAYCGKSRRLAHIRICMTSAAP
jgi:hypothetical protein